MKRSQTDSSLASVLVAVGGLSVAVWILFALEMHMLWPLMLALAMVAIVLISGAIGVWLHVCRRQLMGLVVSLLAAVFFAMLAFTLLASFAVISLSLALLLVIGGLIGVARDVSRR